MPRSQRTLLTWVEREVRACRAVALKHFRSSALRIHTKTDRSPVTAADHAVEEHLRRAIILTFPGETIVGEEFGRSGTDDQSYWIIDPIDGTRAFSRGLPTWAMMIGRVEHGRVTLGLCDFPALDVTIGVAPGVRAFERSAGATQPLPRPRSLPLSNAVVLHGGLRWWPARDRHKLIRVAERCYLERSYGDCYNYLWALRGYADAVIDYGVKPWDLAPLAALAAATGRVLINFSGQNSFAGPDSIMAAPELGRSICRLLHP